ncbi:F-box only protein 21-like isoform X1 [Branchiostoma floridae]|uniref:F-box only protein 21-like isoform X1 n=1 Tax=Branchiostoma floridae TaxID=7739 RepID=A0A9J7M2E8_BRAFL|nr:F-box only protein 21-like isoform X1 [Branchiostoma floridae]
MAAGATINSLADETVEQVLRSAVLDFQDVLNFGYTCSRFNAVARTGEIWRLKLFKRWPSLKMRYSPKKQYNWPMEFENRFKCGRLVRELLVTFSPQFYHKDEVPSEAFRPFSELAGRNECMMRSVLNELMVLLHDKQRKHSDLTLKYYGEKVLRYMQHQHLKGEWQQVLEQPAEQQSLLEGAVLFAQWNNPSEDMTVQAVVQEIDKIVDRVRADISTRNPDHAAIRDNRNQAPPVLSRNECRQVLEGINHVLYNQMNFRGNIEEYYDAKNSFLPYVLERKAGIPITMAILYAEIAKCLGVYLEPVNFPNHFLLRWHDQPDGDSPDDYMYIDAFGKGRFLNRRECANLIDIHGVNWMPDSCYEAVSSKTVFTRMVNNLLSIGRRQAQMGDSSLVCLRSNLDLALLLNPGDIENALLQARVYLHLNINLSEVMENLQQLLERPEAEELSSQIGHMMVKATQQQLIKDDPPKVEQKRRDDKKNFNTEGVIYSVGMIMRHRRYSYNCVIYGWDPQCEMSEEWMIQMGVHSLSMGPNQPFFNVLVADGSNRYAARENLEHHQHPCEITHPEIGRYFQQFTGNYYVPNDELKKRYPQDEEMTCEHFASPETP